MNKSRKEYIETYVFAPDLLSQEEKIEIEQWIRESETLRAIAERYAALEKEIRFIKNSKSKQRPERSEVELKPSRIIRKRNFSFTLAAKTTKTKTGRFGMKTLRTFISEENKTIVRVIRENDEPQVQIYAISEKMDSDDIALLRVPGVTDLMISKPGGVFLLASSQFSDDVVKSWESCMLFTPVDRADLLINPSTGGIFLDTHRSDKEKLSVSVCDKETVIEIHLEQKGNFRADKVIVSDGKKGHLLLINENIIELPKSLVKGGRICLFFFN